MADNKRGREKQAQDADRRQRERAVIEELEREDETEPPTEETTLDEFELELDALDFPATGDAVVEAAGDHELEATDETYTIGELVPDTEAVTFDAPLDVRARVQRPTVAAAIKRILEAGDEHDTEVLHGSQRMAYEKTLRALKTIDADDDDEGIEAITDWILERIREKEKLPTSRAVRRQAAEFCRTNGYQVRNDEWLGI